MSAGGRAAALARLGFRDAADSARIADGAGLDDDALRQLADVAADPDLALSSLAALLATDEGDYLRTAMRADGVLGGALVAVLGTSVALGEHLVRHPWQWRDLPSTDTGNDSSAPAPAPRGRLLAAVGASPDDERPLARGSGPEVLDDLRIAYRRALTGIAAEDLRGSSVVDTVTVALSDLADATLDAALAVARAEAGSEADGCRLAVIAMGKCGGRELNYVSDVDVVFACEPVDGGDEAAAVAAGNRLAASLMRVCSATTAEGTIWPVDAGLRPEGRAGALVRTVASHLAYYRRWARPWEFQALLKARPAAGDVAVGRAYAEAVSPLVWSAAPRPDLVDEVRAMRRRVEASLRSGGRTAAADRELKLGAGGLRDVEFAVQLLQLVHGRTDETLRAGSTLEALDRLRDGGYVGRDDGAALADAYRFLRTLEHRLQLRRLRRVTVVPESAEELRVLGRAMGLRADPERALVEAWRARRREVRRLHERLFYRPLLSAVALLPADDARLGPDAARARLEALGYDDPPAALRHLEALTSGVSRRAAIQRTLLPVMLGWFGESPDPDAGLLGFRRVSEALGGTHWYLRLLRDEGAAAQRLARLLSFSRYASDLLMRAPEAVAMLGADAELTPRSRPDLVAEMTAVADRQDDPADAARAVRAVRRRELFRVAAADVLGRLDVVTVGAAVSDLTAATLVAGLRCARRSVEATRGPVPTRLAVVAMGRLGGAEMSYASDADVLFVHEPVPGADDRAAAEGAHAVAEALRALLAIPAPDPPLVVDPDLRPEGRQGPLVRTLDSYAAYYARWSQTWESQALLRAAPLAGDAEVGDRFVALVDPLRYPEAGLDAVGLREVRRIKARVEAERLPRGADPSLHTKLGRGGLADVEWTVQLLQLRHGATERGLRTTRTVEALEAARAAGLLDGSQAAALRDAWTSASRVRNAVLLARGRPADSLPPPGRTLGLVAGLLGYPPGASGELVDDYRRTARRARGVVEAVFFG